MSILGLTEGEYKFMGMDGEIQTFTDFNDIPEDYTFKYAIKVLPTIPEPPHTLNQHVQIGEWTEMIKPWLEEHVHKVEAVNYNAEQYEEGSFERIQAEAQQRINDAKAGKAGGQPSCVVGHADIPHCSGMVRMDAAKTVYLHKIRWSCQTHVNTPHLLPGKPCPTHSAPIAIGSKTVFVEKLGAGRKGDAIAGCTFVAEGWLDIITGG